MRPLLLGMHWGGERGGLDRYFTELTSNLVPLADPTAIVLGPLDQPPAFVIAGGSEHERLPLRLAHYTRAARAASAGTEVTAAHFALLAWLPVRVVRHIRRAPFVVHFHGPWADESRAAGESALSERAKRVIERSVYRRAAAVIVLSRAFGDVVVDRYGVDAERVHVIPPGVDLERFHPVDRRPDTPVQLPADAFVAFTARRLVPRMGLDTLVRAWARLDAKNEPHLVVAGEGPERPALESLARSLGAQDRIHFVGRISDTDLVTWYQAADVTVVPSTELEGFGLVVLESLACGTPVIATNVGGLPEVLSPLDPTLLVPAGDVDALATRLRDASVNRALPERAACRRHAEGFSWTNTAQRCLDVYRSSTHPRRRVVFTDHCAALSGAEISLLRLAPEIARLWDVHVVLGEDGPLARELSAAGIGVTVLPLDEGVARTTRADAPAAGLRPKTLTTTLAYAVRLSRVLRHLRPDVVQSNSLKAAYYTSVAARLARVPFVWAAKDRVANDYLPERAVQITRWIASYASAVIANSRATLDTLPRTRPGQMRAVIGEPPAPTPVARRPRGVGPVRIGVVGRIAPWKGQDVFLDAFARSFAGCDAEAVIIGAPLFGEESFEAELHRRAADLGIEDRVDFRGFRADVGAELAALDILVHCSTIPEPFGIVVVEGMAAGLPVIATDAGGPAEIITSGVDGVLVPPGDVDALGAEMVRLAGDAAAREAMGDRARERAAAFGADRIARELVDIYGELVSR